MARRRPAQLQMECPGLAEELDGPGTVSIQAVRSSAKEAEKATYSLQGYEPTAVDFIRRCENDAQALEIINYLEGRGKIEPGYARNLRLQLARQGLRSFGSRREPGCYEQETGR